MSRNGKIHTKKRQFRQMPVLAFLNQRLFLQPLPTSDDYTIKRSCYNLQLLTNKNIVKRKTACYKKA